MGGKEEEEEKDPFVSKEGGPSASAMELSELLCDDEVR